MTEETCHNDLKSMVQNHNFFGTTLVNIKISYSQIKMETGRFYFLGIKNHGG